MTRGKRNHLPTKLKMCAYCGSEIPWHRNFPATKFCSQKCYDRAEREKQHKLNPPRDIKLSSGTMGAVSELRVAADLLLRGYEVFRSVSPSASCDLAVLRNGRLLRIEVRTSVYRRDGNVQLRHDNIRADIVANVVPDQVVYEPSLIDEGVSNE